MDDWKKRAAELNAAYEGASLPVHVLTELGNIVLAELYHGRLSRNSTESCSLAGFRLLARHGGRPLESPLVGEITDRQLVLDITAFLVASHFGFLDAVERTFRPIKISASLIPALQGMRDRLLSRQPDVLEDSRRIIELLECGRIKLQSATDSSDGSRSTFTVDCGLGENPGSITVSAVVHALEQTGDLSASDHERS